VHEDLLDGKITAAFARRFHRQFSL